MKEIQTRGAGKLTVTVWPPYIGVSAGEPGRGRVIDGEPFDDIDYRRAMIQWRKQPGGTIRGSAKIAAPKGIYTHLVFCSSPHRATIIMGVRQLEHPIVFDRPGIVEIDPISNRDYLPRQ